jgi:heme a synthase
MVVVGGITRLTLSGLSITEWEPVTGVVPPLNHLQWLTEFARYKEIPQYRALNLGMSLGDFKTIYFWEYAHRLLGRLIGLAYAVPLFWFWLRGRLPARLKPALLGILGLGGAQGLLGWYMVESGLVHRIEVSQYRLVAHLALALLIYTAILWVALGLAAVTRRAAAPHSPAARVPASPRLRGEGWGEGRAGGNWRRWAEVLVGLVALTIAAGGFVAGTGAGFVYNTFPLMGGRLVPSDYAALQPFFRNWFANLAAVQFDHRVLALTTAAAVALAWALGRRAALPHAADRALSAFFAMALLQLALGISTLLLVVPVPLAAAHQAGAVLLLTAAIVFRHALRPGRPGRPAAVMDAKTTAAI